MDVVRDEDGGVSYRMVNGADIEDVFDGEVEEGPVDGNEAASGVVEEEEWGGFDDEQASGGAAVESNNEQQIEDDEGSVADPDGKESADESSYRDLGNGFGALGDDQEDEIVPIWNLFVLLHQAVMHILGQIFVDGLLEAALCMSWIPSHLYNFNCSN